MKEQLKMKNCKRLLACLLCALMLVSVLPVVMIEANAAYENTYTNTGNQRTDIIGVAKTQLGYTEGSNNATKYGTWYGSPNQPWCAMFISWCARQANIPTSILKNSAVAAPDYQYFNIPYYDGSSYTPKSGDLFFTKSWSHVGLVYYIDGNYFYTIEGNSNNNGSSEGTCVCTNRRKISDFYFGVPDYACSEPPADKVTDLKGNVDYSNNLNLSWSPANNATEYKIYVLQKPYNFENIAYQSTTFATSCKITGLQEGEYISFVVSLPCDDIVENESNWYGFKIENAKKINDLKGEIDYSNNLNLNWSAISNATAYEVYVLQAPYNFENIAFQKTVTSTSCKVTGLAEGEYKAFVVSLPCKNIVENESNWYGFKIENANKISDLKGEIDYSNNLNLNWSAVSNATAYEVYVLQEPYNFKNIAFQKTVTSTSCKVTGLAEGEYKAFVVSLPCKNIVENESNWYGFIIENAEKVIEINGELDSAGKLSLNWNPSINATCYEVYVIQAPWSFENVSYQKIINSASCEINNLPEGEYAAFVVALPCNNIVKGESDWYRFNITSKNICTRTGHKYLDYIVEKSATCVESGIKKYTCELCGEVKTETIAKNASNHVGGTTVKNATTATCTATGYTGDTYCNGCNTKLSAGKTIDKTAHTDSNSDGYCDNCKTELTSHKPTDPTPDTPTTKPCDCGCHKTGFTLFIWKIMNFFHKIFGMSQYKTCDCGKSHW